MNIWTILAILLISKRTLAIECSCQRDVTCENSTRCKTEEGGKCYKSLFRNETTGEIIQNLRCLEPHLLVPRGRPFICEYNRRNSHKFVSACCSERNYCNENLNLVLNITESELKAENDNLTNYYGSTQEILLPVILSSVLLLIFISVLLFIRLRKKFNHYHESTSCQSPGRRSKQDSKNSWCSNCCIGM